jgi:hypothetical protein
MINESSHGTAALQPRNGPGTANAIAPATSAISGNHRATSSPSRANRTIRTLSLASERPPTTTHQHPTGNQ